MKGRRGIFVAWMVGLSVVLGAMIAVPRLQFVPVGLAAVAGLISITIVAPRQVVLGLVIIRPIIDVFVRTEVGPISLGQAWSAALVLCVAIALVVDKREGSKGLTSFNPLWFALLYGLLTLPRPDAFDGLMNALRLVAWMLLLGYLSGVCVDVAGRRMVYRAGLALGFVASAVALVLTSQGLYGVGYYFSKDYYVASGVAGPHALSSVCVLALGFPLLGTLTRGDRTRWTPVLIALLVVGVVLSFVRTSLVALVALLGAYLVATVGTKRQFRSLLTVFILSAAGFVALWFFQGLVLSRIMGAGESGVSLSDPLAGSGRILVWRAVIAKSFSTFWGSIFGYGPNASFEAVRDSVGPSIWSHNDFLEILITGGLFLFIGYIVLAVWLWRAVGSSRTVAPDNHDVRSVVMLGRGMVAAYLILSFFNGILLGQASVVLACFAALLLGWRHEMVSVGPERAVHLGILEDGGPT